MWQNCIAVDFYFAIVIFLSVRMDVTAVNRTSEYEKKLSDPRCCLMAISIRQHLTLPPKYLGKMADGIREQLDSKLKLYSEEYVEHFVHCFVNVLLNDKFSM